MVNRHLTYFLRNAAIVVFCAKVGHSPSKNGLWCVFEVGFRLWIIPEEEEKLIKKINEYEKKLTDFDDGAL